MCEAPKFLKKKPEFKRKKKKCDNPQVYLKIQEGTNLFEICRKCWGKISKSTLSW